ncbi:MAG: hypothetical protein Q7R93_05410 [bacterium]|nr:hypothetical protein [bacterium]
MSNTLIQELFSSMKEAKKVIAGLAPKQKSALEKEWDVEHAYYSSALEGSKIDRKEFEKLGEQVA